MTKQLILTAALLSGLLAYASAEDKDALQAAIKQLAEKGSYSWTSTTARPGVDDNGDQEGRRRWRSGPTMGKTASGIVHLQSTFGDRTMETLIKGKKIAVKRDEGWITVEEEAAGDGGERRRRGGFARRYRDFKAPAAQAEELLGKCAGLKKDGDTYTSELSKEDATSLLSFGGRGRRGGDDGGDRPEPTGVKATVTFWVSEGVLTKFETSVAGAIAFNGNERDLSRVTTIQIKDAGATTIDLGDDAKKALED